MNVGVCWLSSEVRSLLSYATSSQPCPTYLTQENQCVSKLQHVCVCVCVCVCIGVSGGAQCVCVFVCMCLCVSLSTHYIFIGMLISLQRNLKNIVLLLLLEEQKCKEMSLNRLASGLRTQYT